MTNTPSNHLEQYIEDTRILKKPDLQRLLGISRSTLGRWIKDGIFPPPKQIINGRSMWEFQDYKKWRDLQHKQLAG